MIDRTSFASISLLSVLCLGTAGFAANQPSKWELRRLWRDAQEAVRTEQLDQAIGHYRSLVAAETGPARLEALYLASVLELNQVESAIDLAHLKADLAEVAGTSGERRWEASALLAALEANQESGRRLASCEAAGSASAAAWASEREELESRTNATSARLSSLEAERDQSRRETRACQRELEETRTELARKEHALAKVRETLVGSRTR